MRAFLVWSRMPIVFTLGGKAYLTDQRYYSAFNSTFRRVRKSCRASFLIPLDKPARA